MAPRRAQGEGIKPALCSLKCSNDRAGIKYTLLYTAGSMNDEDQVYNSRSLDIIFCYYDQPPRQARLKTRQSDASHDQSCLGIPAQRRFRRSPPGLVISIISAYRAWNPDGFQRSRTKIGRFCGPLTRRWAIPTGRSARANRDGNWFKFAQVHLSRVSLGEIARLKWRFRWTTIACDLRS